jgi:hypothetical protein
MASSPFVEPVPEIGGMVVPELRRDAEVGAQESGSPVPQQVPRGLTLIAKAFRAEIAFKAALVHRLAWGVLGASSLYRSESVFAATAFAWAGTGPSV